MPDPEYTVESAVAFLANLGMNAIAYSAARKEYLARQKENPLRVAAKKLHTQLERHMWTNGGFLQGIGEGVNPQGDPVLHVYLVRPLHPFETRFVPDTVNDIPTVIKFQEGS